jgi:ankyrin repeat protein
VILSIQQSEAEREYICLIDAQRGRPFAYHEVRGMRRHPPVRYDDPPLLAGVMHAVESGDIELMRQLLQQGADVNVRTETGRTPLMRAAQYKRSQMLRFLIDNGADVNLADNGRRTCLYLLNGDDGTICRMLLEAGANVHHHDGRTGSPLMTAAAYARSLEVVRMLVDAGSPLDHVDYQGRTLIKLAEGNKIPGIAESLKRATAQRQD